MEICFATGSILFLLNVSAVAGFFLMCLFKLILLLRYHLFRQPQYLNKTKNKSQTHPNKDSQIKDLDFPVEGLPQSNSQLSAVEPLKDSASAWASASAVELPLRQFTYESLLNATYNFTSQFLMNVDALGDVFMLNMLHTNEIFVVKRLKEVSFMTDQEFYQELLLLSQLNHSNLAKLIGYSNDQGRRALIYEYLRGGSLQTYLHGNKTFLDWKTRMKIVVGVARAIQHLHNAMNPPILHCYIEPANVWLDEDFTPKLSAAGVVRMFPTSNRTGCPLETYGSYAYGDNDYCLTRTVTVVADIYGFGILLLEVITAKKGIFYTQDGARQTLIGWVQPYFKDGDLMEMVDPRIKGKIDENELNEACAIAEACLEKQPGRRPQIADVVRRLDALVG